MNTIRQSIGIHEKMGRNHPKGIAIWFNGQVENFEKTRFGWMAIYITVQSCLGSAAAAYILENKASDFMLMACAGITMGCNAIFIAQAPPKWCLFSFI